MKVPLPVHLSPMKSIISNLNNLSGHLIFVLFFAFGFFSQSSKAIAEISLSGENLTDELSFSDEYIDPFLITTASKHFKVSPKTIESLIREKLKMGRLNVRGNFSTEGISQNTFTKGQYALPKQLFDESQMEAIKNCSAEKCLMKLKTDPEVFQLKLSKNKKETYQQLVFNRIKNYLKHRELLGYEERKSNEPLARKMVALISSLSKSPKTQRYLKDGFWKLAKEPGQPINSWLRQEMVIIAPDQMQPILRVSEDFEFQEGSRRLFFELHIYTNHYFDSSLILYEVVTFKEKPNECEVIVTDVMEIDELKKTALIRALFKGKMVKAVTTYQGQFLESVSSLAAKK